MGLKLQFNSDEEVAAELTGVLWRLGIGHTGCCTNLRVPDLPSPLRGKNLLHGSTSRRSTKK
jgi:hypothetical protein